jgi:DNA-binding response OmpR family regulator
VISEENRADGGCCPHVLVVEDDRPLREALCTFVSREGYEATGACDGVAALEALTARRPDIIILDLVLPRMDGYQFMEALALRFGRGRPRVLVLSAAERLDLARARLGAEAYIAKPFDIERLRAALLRLARPLQRQGR